MVNIAKLAEAKSDQLNAADLIGTTREIVVRDIKVHQREQQPLEIFFEGEDTKCWRPAKACVRTLGYFWEYETDIYIGRTIRLFNEKEVMHAGKKVGGLRICGLSDIKETETIKIKEGRGRTIAYKVEKLEGRHSAQGGAPQQTPPPLTAEERVNKALDVLAKCKDKAGLDKWLANVGDLMASLNEEPEQSQKLNDAFALKEKEVAHVSK